MSHDDSVNLNHLSVTRERTVILDDLSLRLQPGSITGLIGPSGSGKTTLMRVLVGVQKYRGTVTLLGKPAGDRSLRSRIGYVTQSPAVYGDLTVRQNLQYFAVITGVSRRRVDEVLADVQLTDYSGRRVDRLSGGQRARVSLGIALLGDPELLVMDEPTVGLDPILRDELWRLFARIAATGKTVIVSSHVMDEAERCENILLIREGKLLWNGSRRTLLQTTGTSSVGEAFVSQIGAAA